MLKTFLDLQQRQLEAEGEEQRRLQQRLLREQARQRALDECRENLATHAARTEALSLQNLAAMRRQLDHVAAYQAQQEAVANLDAVHQNRVVREQVRRVKSLQQVIRQRLAQAAEEQQRKEQKAMEEMVMRTTKPY